MTKKKGDDKGYESGGIAFVGLILIGVGVGFLVGDIVSYTLFGIGAGFIAMAIFRAILGRK